jgi:glycogen synthase
VKILFVSNLYPPNQVGGYERLCHQVAQALASRGHSVHVLTSDFGGREQVYADMTVTRSLKLLADNRDIYRPFEISGDMRDTINGHNIAQLRRVVGEVKPDLIFGWNLYFFDASLQAAMAEFSAPTVFFLTDNWLIAAQTPERIHAHFDNHVRNDKPFFVGDRPADQASPHIAIFGSEFVRQLYRSCGYSFSQEIVVHNGVVPPSQDPALAPDRLRLHTPSVLKLLFAGRFVDLKGPQDCVAALPAIQAELGPSVTVQLTMIGDQTDASFWGALQAQIAASPYASAISILPTVSEGELIDYFNTSDIYLFPSHYEPFALTLILAMAAGVPTVASNVGGNREILINNRTGLLYEKSDINGLASAVARLYRDPELRADLAARGRNLARRFTFGRMINQLEDKLTGIAGSDKFRRRAG